MFIFLIFTCDLTYIIVRWFRYKDYLVCVCVCVNLISYKEVLLEK